MSSSGGEPQAKGPTEKSRKLGFFGLTVQWRDSIEKPSPEVDWAKEVGAFLGESDGVKVELPTGIECVFAARGDSSVIVAKRLPALDIQQVQGETLTIGPVPMAQVDDFLARASFACFCPFNAFGMLLPPPGAPAAATIAQLANEVHPIEGGQWKAAPITSAAQIKEFERTQNITRLNFRGTISSQGGLFDEPGTMGAAFSRIAALTGADLSVSIELKVKAAHRHPSALRRLRQAIHLGDFKDAKKLSVSTLDSPLGGYLELLPHSLTTTMELPVIDGSFDEKSLVTEMQQATSEMQDRIKQGLNLAKG